SLRLSLKAHPLSFLRAGLAAEGVVEARRLAELPDGGRVRIAGLVLVRQRPGTARGVIFATLEDETGTANVIVWPDVFEAHRKIVLGARLLGVSGPLQREGLVIHVIAERLVDLTPRLAQLTRPETSDEAEPESKRLATAEAAELQRTYPSRDFH
ncbi:MAG TPA: OB-fold nucleic acid binding domain-containing protein, partial [Kiloniellales bacterium]|nr:OB-fold nucleic acid binding domain-containing protein [Kiloniellales bacterium]